ncbi:nmrA-like family domain-containing protein 1 isoform X3 [Hyla sarda]|uniref:nmrA-like family domain-containing protein 1 isoform X3 n=1 Tax=Hyla sarda TaxID=327740 RepID=UPI0024C293CC|nr:nmrA-like family domain-containing protein 1 isoform X3 [Hyla sarda]
MAGKRVIVVFGATGAQGGSVAEALLADGTFAVRAVTRDTSKPAAVKLKKAGAEVVSADLEDEKSLEVALSGAYGAFVVTNAHEGSKKDKEVIQGKLVADLCKRFNLELVVYSGLENVKKMTGGKLDVSHFDSKGEVEEYFRHIDCPMTSVRLAFYYENLLSASKPKRSKDGKMFLLVLCALPGLPMGDVPLDGISVADLGPVVVSILKSPECYKGRNIGLSAGKLTVEEYAKIMSTVTKEDIRDAKILPDTYEEQGGAHNMANMFRFYMMRPDRDVELTHKLNPKIRNFQQWMKENKEALKI